MTVEADSSFSGLERFQAAKRIVIKLGSALLVDAKGNAHQDRMNRIADDIHRLIQSGKQIVLVSSGSIALGKKALGLSGSNLKLEEKQAAAATGQLRLMRAWEDALAHYSIPVAQALLTFDDTETRRRWLNARATLNTLLQARALPIVNENDTVATEEIRYGDNDRLGARVAQMIGADILVLLSDIDGLYTADPRIDSTAQHIPIITELTDDIIAMGGGANSDTGLGTGGMATKLQAARIAMMAGCATIIMKGDSKTPEKPLSSPLQALENGARSTWFIPELTPETARLQWLSGALNPSGTLIVDEGAAKALKNGKSLLHAGVTRVEGQFDRGDAVKVEDIHGKPIARGISAYSSDDAKRLIGCNSSQIETILGFKGRPALIHKNDMVQT